MAIQVQQLELQGLLLFSSNVFRDERGYFMESFKESAFLSENNPPLLFKQDNISSSKKGVLRGLHYQLPPHGQGKLVRVLQGKIWDVAVDIRKNSPTFKKWFGVELSEDNPKALYIPPGFAHGFVALENDTLVLYKCTVEYEPKSERGIRWDDPGLNISWPLKDPILSSKDANYPFLEQAELFN